MATGKRILYFIKGTTPTEDELFKAGLLNTSMFRAATFFNEADAVEICDAVAGEAPELYRKRFGYVEPPKIAPVKDESPKEPQNSPVVTTQPTWAKNS